MRPGRAADHSPSSSAAVMEEQSYTSTHPLGHTGPVTGSLYLLLYAVIMCIHDDNALIIIREDAKTLFCSSKFSWELELTFVVNLASRLRKGFSLSFQPVPAVI